jgi:hypothetical protein
MQPQPVFNAQQVSGLKALYRNGSAWCHVPDGPPDVCAHDAHAPHRLQELPDALCGLQLVLLDLTNNCLRRLPPALGHMTSLRSIPLDGNPLKLMRRDLWAGAAPARLHSSNRCLCSLSGPKSAGVSQHDPFHLTM